MNASPPARTGRPGRTRATVIALLLLLAAAGAFFIATGADGHGSAPAEDDGHGHGAVANDKGAPRQAAGAHADEADEGKFDKIAMSDAQIQAAGIVLARSEPGRIGSTLQLPGEIRLNEDRTVHVVPRVAGVVQSVSANLGQTVRGGQTLAVLSSAAISDLRAELQAAQRRRELAQTRHERERTLWMQKISPEQDVLQARQALREAEIAVANAAQKLRALGAAAGAGALGWVPLRAPFDATVVEKHLATGEAVREDTRVFTLSDLSTVWAEMRVDAEDLPRVRVGDHVRVRAGAGAGAGAADAGAATAEGRILTAEGRILFVGSLIGAQTRTAPARVELSNPQGAWRPGLFVTVEVPAGDGGAPAPVTVLTEALQTVDGQPTVFVKVADGFAARPVRTGRSDGQRVEILDGLQPGEPYAATGSFVVKSEQGKRSAAHTH